MPVNLGDICNSIVGDVMAAARDAGFRAASLEPDWLTDDIKMNGATLRAERRP